jgi:diguanylate cyclase (GGDEF)-like protein/PAS domain S-box-containing protein
VNAAGARMFGRAGEALLGEPLGALVVPDCRAALDAHLAAAAKQARVDRTELVCLRPDGETFAAELTSGRLEGGDEVRIQTVVRDVTGGRAAQKRVHFLAHYDALTGLPNRALFFQRLAYHVADARRYRENVALLFVSVDGLAEVNEAYGHDVGDALLRAFAERLKTSIRETDTAARMGGDEFTAALPRLQNTRVAPILDRIAERLTEPYQLEAGELRITVSLGHSLYPRDAREMLSLVRAADAAMNEVKRRGRDAAAF